VEEMMKAMPFGAEVDQVLWPYREAAIAAVVEAHA
jgi:hypothetical protein